MNPLSKIPQIEKLISHPILGDAVNLISKPFVAKVANEYLHELRDSLKIGFVENVPSISDCAKEVMIRCKPIIRKRITSVLNATGIVLHTNMGRTPLPQGVWQSVSKVGCGYSTIEMDLKDGKRGKRFEFLTECMATITGSEDAVMVNNNAAAVFLMLKTFAENKEVIVARGQQIQIGGGFRIPEILKAAGCTLVEVGTTNITTIKDICAGINENTAMVLWVHTSNYKVRGFTQEPSVKDIKAALPNNIMLAVDQGSGNVNMDIPEEPSVVSLIRDGADLVCFSGDKIFGGPQAGWIVGKNNFIRDIAKHQLMRTYRVGRAVAGLMEACLVHYLNGGHSVAGNAMICDPLTIMKRCEKVVSMLPEGCAKVISHKFSLGGGSTPDTGFDSWAIQLSCKKSADELKKNLRELDYPVICIVENDKVLLDLMTVDSIDDEYLVKAINEVLV